MTTIRKLNLLAHVAGKDGAIRFGERGTESSDGQAVYLCIPYVGKPTEDIVGSALPAEKASAMARAVNTAKSKAASEPERFRIQVTRGEDGSIAMAGLDKTGEHVAMSGPALPDPFEPPEVEHARERTLNLDVKVLAALAKAATEAGAQTIELGIGETTGQILSPVTFELAGDDGAAVGHGYIAPTCRS